MKRRALFRPRPATAEVTAFVDEHRDQFGRIEPIHVGWRLADHMRTDPPVDTPDMPSHQR